MKPVRLSLFAKIILWFFLNLILLALFLFIAFSFSFQLDFPSVSAGKFEGVARSIEEEFSATPRDEWGRIIERFSSERDVEFVLFDNAGRQLAGRSISLPPELDREIRFPEGGPPRGGGRRPPPPGRASGFVRTENPTLYWGGFRIMLPNPEGGEPIRARIIAVSDSRTGRGLFIDPTPWLLVVAFVVLGSMLFWLPFVRRITRSVAQMTNATEQIAAENFDVRVDQSRTDELGRLGSSINKLAGRLSGFVSGQRRFLGDVSHELNSPLARMQFALEILDERTDGRNREYVRDAKEDVQLMTRLVSELLEYTRAGLAGATVQLRPIDLGELVHTVVRRESARGDASVLADIPEGLDVMGDPSLLSKAVGNSLRNAIRYAGDAGPIRIEGVERGGSVELRVTDTGDGVPEEMIDKLFDPFFRVETHRSRETGGTGLGLAIVKTAVEACGGSVRLENVEPKGFRVIMQLRSARNGDSK